MSGNIRKHSGEINSLPKNFETTFESRDLDGTGSSFENILRKNTDQSLEKKIDVKNLRSTNAASDKLGLKLRPNNRKLQGDLTAGQLYIPVHLRTTSAMKSRSSSVKKDKLEDNIKRRQRMVDSITRFDNSSSQYCSPAKSLEMNYIQIANLQGSG